MKSRKFIFILLLILLINNIIVLSKDIPTPIFMGEVLDIQKSPDEQTLKVRVKGYLKNCSVYEEELIAIIGKETEYLKECTEPNIEEKMNIEKGDIVYLVLSEAFASSYPPQSFAKKILISKKTL